MLLAAAVAASQDEQAFLSLKPANPLATKPTTLGQQRHMVCRHGAVPQQRALGVILCTQTTGLKEPRLWQGSSPVSCTCACLPARDQLMAGTPCTLELVQTSQTFEQQLARFLMSAFLHLCS